MLVHICCSVDSHFFLQELKKFYPNERLIGFFYNPNIHPKEEYDLRFLDVENSCETLGIELLCGDWELDSWLERTNGFEHCDEKGERCLICFEERLQKTALLAHDLGEKSITTTLLASPMKNSNDLFQKGSFIAQNFGLEFIEIDVRSGGGTQRQTRLAKEENLYRQNYCGCIYALEKQRKNSSKIALELFSEISGRVRDGDAKYNIEIFKKIHSLKKSQIPFILQKQTINTYRLLGGFAFLKSSKTAIPSYIFTHSKSANNLKCDISWHKIKLENITQHLKHKKNLNLLLGFAKNALFIDIQSINLLFNTNYKNTTQMLYNPPPYELELNIRHAILGEENIMPFVVLDSAFMDSALASDFMQDSISKDSTHQKTPINQIFLNINSVFQNSDIFRLIKLDL